MKNGGSSAREGPVAAGAGLAWPPAAAPSAPAGAYARLRTFPERRGRAAAAPTRVRGPAVAEGACRALPFPPFLPARSPCSPRWAHAKLVRLLQKRGLNEQLDPDDGSGGVAGSAQRLGRPRAAPIGGMDTSEIEAVDCTTEPALASLRRRARG